VEKMCIYLIMRERHQLLNGWRLLFCRCLSNLQLL
jgi:ribosome modulation factor